MEYVLIILFFSNEGWFTEGKMTSEKIEFKTMEACEKAKENLEKQFYSFESKRLNTKITCSKIN